MAQRPTDLIPPRPRGKSRRFIALLPGQAERVQDLADLLHMDRFRASQLLRRPLPLLDFASADLQARVLGLLRKAEFRCVAFDQGALDDIPSPTWAKRVTLLDADTRAHAGPYRTAPSLLHVVDLGGAESTLGLGELRLAVIGKLVRHQSFDKEAILLMGESSLHVRRERQQRREAYAVVDLYGDLPAPLRLFEPLTSIVGFGLRAIERARAFFHFQQWLEGHSPPLTLQATFQSAALRIEAVTVGKTRIRDTAAEWDGWSARAWLIFQLAQRS